MSDFYAKAEVYRAAMRHPSGHYPMLASPPIRIGTAGECFAYVLTKHDGYPRTYSVRVPLEAGFGKNELSYDDIEAISKRSDFPRT
jgi:hypothetical protein